MDPTVVVAVAGIVGTLLAAVLSPSVSEWMRRKSTRLDRLTTERIAAYADLLRATARLADNAMTWSAIPLADLPETEDAELDRIISRVRVVASKDVYTRLEELRKRVHTFNLMLHQAKQYHAYVQRETEAADDARAMQQRMDMGSVAERIVEAHKAIEATIRKELRG